MIDFGVKDATEKRGGLNLGFSAGPYRRKESRLGAVYVAEDAFALLEPSILHHYPRYRNFGHWGVTSISRDEWQPIIAEWDKMGKSVGHAATFDALCEAAGLTDEVRRVVGDDLETTREAIVEMLQTLIAWLRSALMTHDEVCVLGI